MSEPPRAHEAPAATPPAPGPLASDAQVVSDPEVLARTTAELARKTAEVQILQRVSADINSTLDLEEICDVALRTMDELFEFHHANIFLLESGGQTLKVVASRGYENQATGGRVQIGAGVVGVVAQKRRMMHVSNLGQQRAYAAAQRREIERSGRQAQLGEAIPVPGLANAECQIAVPLLIRDDLIGVFSIESPVPRSFGEHERDLVSIVANQIASAIHNARLYEQRRLAAAALQEANVSLEARVVERTAALERELRVAQALLNEARHRVEGPLLGRKRRHPGAARCHRTSRHVGRAALAGGSYGVWQGSRRARGARRVRASGRVHLCQLPRDEYSVSTCRRRDNPTRFGTVSHRQSI